MDHISLIIIFVLNSVLAEEYYVSPLGSDSNPGTLREPWLHVQRAVSELKPGDVCTIRGGVYREEIVVKGLKGTAVNPITFRAYPGENVIFDGTFAIKGSWTVFKDDIYSIKLESDIWQLFVNGEMQINARWPNAFWYDYSVFDYTRWGFSSPNATYNLAQGAGIMIDNGTQDLASSGINATGAIAILNIGQWLTWAGQVTEHKIGSDTFSYSLAEPKPKAVHFVARNCRYFLEDKLEFLDAPSEWYYDPASKMLYLWLKSSDNPEKYDIRGKNSTYAFMITDASSWIILKGLNFFATTVYAKGKSGEYDVDNIKLDSCNFTYPSYSKRMLGSLAVPNTTTIYYNSDLTLHAGNFTVTNCIFEYADGQTIDYRGADGVFENNLWHHNDFTCVGDGALFQSRGVRDNFIGNTVHSNGPSVGFSPGSGNTPDRTLGLPIGANVSFNMFYDLKYLQNDGSHVQTQIASQNGTILQHNWCFDTRKWGLRFDRVDQPNASWGYNGTMGYNVVWGTAGIRLKGDKHHCYNNLAFNNSNNYDIALFGYPGDGIEGENVHTKTTANILEHGACGKLKSTPPCPNIPGDYSNKYVGDIHKVIRDPANFDFRPFMDSQPVTDNMGPYSADSLKHGGTYWIPGYKEEGASMPIPFDGCENAGCDADLMWRPGYKAYAHNIYFGNSTEAVFSATMSSPEFIGHMVSPANVAKPRSTLQESKQYYWRIDAIKDSSTSDVVKGVVWKFKCSNNS